MVLKTMTAREYLQHIDDRVPAIVVHINTFNPKG
jgi:hypothetical protein